MKRIILTFGLVLSGLALFSQIPRIRLNQVQKDTVWGSVLISSLVDSSLTYSRDFYIGPDTSLNFYGTVLVAGGGGGGGSFVTTTILSDSLTNYILKVAGFGGDVTGTYDNIIVTDDSHNHIIGNVDGLQTALDGKLTSVNAGVGLTGSGTTGSPLLVDTSGTIVSKNFYFANLPAGGGGTVTSVDIAAGTGISVSGSPITTSGTITVTNSAPDQTVSLTGAGINTVTGTYPSFTITGTEVDGSTTNELQTISTSGAAGNISLSNGGGTLNLNVNDADASATNEGSLSVGAGGANSSDIVSNTSGSTNVTIAGSGAVTVTESGSTITISATGGGSSFNNLTETADTVFVAKYLNVDTATLYVDADLNRVGIGTSAPTEKLDVDGNLKGLSFISYADTTDYTGGAFQAMDFNLEPPQASTGNLLARFRVFTNFASSRGLFAFQKFRGTLASPQGVLNNDVIGAIGFAPSLTTGNAGTATALVEAYADADATSTEAAARLSFVTGSTSANRTERLTIKSDGKIGMGTTTPTDELHNYRASGSIFTRTESASIANGETSGFSAEANSRLATIGVTRNTGSTNAVGFIYLNARDNDDNYLWVDSTITYNLRISQSVNDVGNATSQVVGGQSSDIRLKTDLGVFPYGLNEVMQLKPSLFSYKQDYTMNRNLGFYAQEVLPIIPEVVFDTKETLIEGEPTRLYMQYVFLVPVLTKAIQEQQAIIESQKAEIEQLKTQYNELLQRIITLENK